MIPGGRNRSHDRPALCFQWLANPSSRNPGVSSRQSPGVWRTESARTGAQRWARGQRPGAHAKAWAERRRNIAQGLPTAGAAAFLTKRTGRIGSQPVASRFALRIDALHGEAGQELHIVFPSATGALHGAGRVARTRVPLDGRPGNGRLLARILAQDHSAVKGKYHYILGCPCPRQLAHSMPRNRERKQGRRA
jgi:hypothetical protein